jgi:hypothetical protein
VLSAVGLANLVLRFRLQSVVVDTLGLRVHCPRLDDERLRIQQAHGAVVPFVGEKFRASILAASRLLSRKTVPLIAGISIPGVVSVAVGVFTWRRLQMKRPDTAIA